MDPAFVETLIILIALGIGGSLFVKVVFMVFGWRNKNVLPAIDLKTQRLPKSLQASIETIDRSSSSDSLPLQLTRQRIDLSEAGYQPGNLQGIGEDQYALELDLYLDEDLFRLYLVFSSQYPQVPPQLFVEQRQMDQAGQAEAEEVTLASFVMLSNWISTYQLVDLVKEIEAHLVGIAVAQPQSFNEYGELL